MKYNEPTMKIVKMTKEDVLTNSELTLTNNGFETGSTGSGSSGPVPFDPTIVI